MPHNLRLLVLSSIHRLFFPLYDNLLLVSHSHFCDGSPDEVAEDMKKQLDANPNTIQVILLSCVVLSCLVLSYFLLYILLPLLTFRVSINIMDLFNH